MPAIRHFAQAVVVATFAVALSGCSSGLMDGIWGDDNASTTSAGASIGTGVSPDMAASQEGAEVAKLYNEGLASLKEGQNKSAIKKFAEVERQFPYSSLATKSILMQAYAYYLQGNFDDTVNAANRFITLHPGTGMQAMPTI